MVRLFLLYGYAQELWNLSHDEDWGYIQGRNQGQLIKLSSLRTNLIFFLEKISAIKFHEGGGEEIKLKITVKEKNSNELRISLKVFLSNK